MQTTNVTRFWQAKRFSLFMWVWRFLILHKTATGASSVLVLQRFLASVTVWEYRFSPHAVHGSMQKRLRCGCGSMYRLVFCRESFESMNNTVQSGTIMTHTGKLSHSNQPQNLSA